MQKATFTLNVKLVDEDWQELKITPAVLSRWETSGPPTPNGIDYRSLSTLDRYTDFAWIIWKALRVTSSFEKWLDNLEDFDIVEDEVDDSPDPTEPQD